MKNRDEILDRIKFELKDQDYKVIEWSYFNENDIHLRKVVCETSKIESWIIPSTSTRFVNVYQLMYELKIIQ